MQQTADAVAETKDLTIVDADLETTLVSGLSYFSYAVAVTVSVLTVAAVVMTAAYGSSSCCSAVAVLVTTEAVADATTTAATNTI